MILMVIVESRRDSWQRAPRFARASLGLIGSQTPSFWRQAARSSKTNWRATVDQDVALRLVGVTRAARPPRVPEHCDRPRCDIVHQPDLGHIPSVGERFCDERKLAPA